MSFTVRLMRQGTPVYVFATPTPFVVPDHTAEFNDQIVPRLTAVVKTWNIEGVLFGNETSVATQYDTLVAAIENSGSYPDGIQLLRGTSQSGVIIGDLSTSAGWLLFKIEKLTIHKSPLIFRGELRFTMRVTAKKFFLPGELVSNISSLKLTESWSYAASGLLTHTLQGELEVQSGSAVAAARSLVPQIFTIPGATFAFETKGPEGADIEKLARADNKARFRSTIRESGDTLPSGVGPDFSIRTTTSQSNGEVSASIAVSAVGPGAEAAVRAAKPTGASFESVSVDTFRRTASAIYTTTTKEGKLLRLHEFTTRGGGKGIAFSRLTGDRPPAEHRLARGPCEIIETIRVEVTGTPSMDDFLLPEPVAGLDEDTDAATYTLPTRVKIGRDRSTDEWTMQARRVYRSADSVSIPSEVGDAIFRPRQSVTPTREFSKKAAGGGGSNREDLTFGGGLSGPMGLF